MPLKNVVVLALCSIVSLTCYFAAARNRYSNLFAEVIELVEREHLQAPKSDVLFESAMSGMLSRLDQHSVFLSGKGYRSFDESIEQKFGGVGMYVGTDPGSERLMVNAPMPNTPALRAGLQPFDLIIAINGVSTKGKSREECVEEMRGVVGSPLELTIDRAGNQFDVQLIREIIPVNSVFGDTANPDGSQNFFLKDYPWIGYIRIDSFGVRTEDEVREAIRKVAPQIEGLIIDLRNNGGGPIDAAVAVADMFLEAGKTVVTTRGRRSSIRETYATTPAMELRPDVPIAILVNGQTASASEIVAACLQDYDRAIVIGEQTYGKGTVQSVFPLERDSSAVKLTVANYCPPRGRCIDRSDPENRLTGLWGVLPNPGMELDVSPGEAAGLMLQVQMRQLEGILGEKAPELPPIKIPAKLFEKRANADDSEDDPGELNQSAGDEEETITLPIDDRALLKGIEWMKQNRKIAPALKSPLASGNHLDGRS